MLQQMRAFGRLQPHIIEGSPKVRRRHLVKRLAKAILRNDVGGHRGPCVAQVKGLASLVELSKSPAESVHDRLDGAVELSNRALREKRSEGSTSPAVKVMVHSGEFRIIVVTEHLHRPVPLVGSFGGSRVDFPIVLLVVDVEFIWIDTHNGTCSGSKNQSMTRSSSK